MSLGRDETGGTFHGEADPSPAEHAATILGVLSDEATSPHPDDWGGTRAQARDALAALVAQADRAAFIPRETDEKPSDAMPPAGTKDWRESSEWWMSTCEYWNGRATAAEARADQLQRERDELGEQKERGIQASKVWIERAERAEAALREILHEAGDVAQSPKDAAAAANRIARAALAGEPGAASTNRYGHGRGCVCPLCSQSATALAGETNP